MSRLNGLLDPEARAYFEAIEAAVRPGRHQPESKNGDPQLRDDSSNTVGNFCFEVSLSYRRVERPRRVSGTQ